MTAEPIPPPLAAAGAQVRPAAEGDAVAGVMPRFVAAPASTEQASAVLAAAAGLGLAVVPRGTGSRLGWGTPPSRCDLVLDTTRMNQVVEHEAGDLVATVQAGISTQQLAGVLGAAGQRLALDPPGGGTVGGVLAAGAAGPLRLRYGTPRDLLIGITIVRADGTVARAGGKVVKNVAGYDLGKLFAGSRGALGLITQATFRLHPVPARTEYLTAQCAAAVDACELVAAAVDSAASPVAVELDWPSAGSPVRLGVMLEGDQAGVAERAAALADLLARPQAPDVARKPPAWWGSGPAAQTGGTVIQVAFWPGDLGMVLAEIRAAAEAAELDPAVGGSAAAGVLHVALPAGAPAAAVAEMVTALRGAVGHGLTAETSRRLSEAGQPVIHPKQGARRVPARTAPGGGPDGQPRGTGTRSPEGPPARATVVILHAPPTVAGLVDLFGPVPSLALMRAVKRQFDPAGTMAPGRFAGGI